MSTMHYVRSGSGAPPILFVHGFTCDHTDWDPQIAHFSKQHDVAACDLRGHGKTPGGADDLRIENFGADCAALLRELGWKNAILVGHSMGCRVVMQAALDAPDRVGGLVLVDGSTLGGKVDPDTVERTMREGVSAIGFQAMGGAMFGEMFSDRSDPARKAAIIARAVRFGDDNGIALFPRTAAWDARHLEHALTAIKAPMLVLQSTVLSPDRKRVPVTPGMTVPYFDIIRRLKPDTKIEVMAGVGHFIGLDDPAGTNQAIERFVGGLN